MENLRQAIELDLKDSLETEWKIVVELTSPDGLVQKLSANDPAEPLGGQVLYYTRRENPITGEIMVVNEPVVTLRQSSLDRIPAAGETWFIKFPVAPTAGAEIKSWVFTPTRSTEHGTDIGFIRIYPQRIENTGEPVS